MNLDFKISEIYSKAIDSISDSDITAAAKMAQAFLDGGDVDPDEYYELKHVWEAFVEPRYDRSDSEVEEYFSKVVDDGDLETQLLKSLVEPFDNSTELLSIINFIDQYGY